MNANQERKSGDAWKQGYDTGTSTSQLVIALFPGLPRLPLLIVCNSPLSFCMLQATKTGAGKGLGTGVA